MSDSYDNDAIGCISTIFFILVIWSLIWGLPINNKLFHIDIFPPSMRIESIINDG